MSAKITHERLLEVLHYDPETGDFRWIEPGPGRRQTKQAGSLNKMGYITIDVDSQRYFAHNLAWFYVYKEWPKMLDHKKGRSNRIDNLRIATQSQNLANMDKPRHNTSGYKGVCWHKKAQKWMAYIQVNGKLKYLGLYTDIEEASKAYLEAAEIYFGDFAR